jgi:hypothetical protein
MKDVLTGNDVHDQVEANYRAGKRAERTDDRLTAEDWEAQSDDSEGEERND